MELYIHSGGRGLALQEFEPTAKVATIAASFGTEGAAVWVQGAGRGGPALMREFIDNARCSNLPILFACTR